MQTKMSVYIKVTPRVKSKEMYERLKAYEANVLDLGANVYVIMQIDIRETNIKDIIAICKEYGDCFVDARLVDEKSPSE